MKEKSLTVASAIAAIVASLCCIGPVFDERRVTAQQIGAKVKAAGVNVLAVRSNG